MNRLYSRLPTAARRCVSANGAGGHSHRMLHMQRHQPPCRTPCAGAGNGASSSSSSNDGSSGTRPVRDMPACSDLAGLVETINQQQSDAAHTSSSGVSQSQRPAAGTKGADAPSSSPNTQQQVSVLFHCIVHVPGTCSSTQHAICHGRCLLVAGSACSSRPHSSVVCCLGSPNVLVHNAVHALCCAKHSTPCSRLPN